MADEVSRRRIRRDLRRLSLTLRHVQTLQTFGLRLGPNRFAHIDLGCGQGAFVLGGLDGGDNAIGLFDVNLGIQLRQCVQVGLNRGVRHELFPRLLSRLRV